MTTTDYQVMPPLTAEEYAALEADILARGILVPVVLDQHGNLLDGHHRRAIAQQHHLPCPSETRHAADAEQARDIAFTLNLARRHLNREQKRALIVAEINRRPDDSDRAIGRRLACDHKTVGAVRRELSGEIPQPHLTAAQERRVELLLQAMKGRTLRVVERIQDGEDIRMFPLLLPSEGDDLDVVIAAHAEYFPWSCTAPELQGALWDCATA